MSIVIIRCGVKMRLVRLAACFAVHLFYELSPYDVPLLEQRIVALAQPVSDRKPWELVESQWAGAVLGSIAVGVHS